MMVTIMVASGSGENDREVVLTAVAESGTALRYASLELKAATEK